ETGTDFYYLSEGYSLVDRESDLNNGNYYIHNYGSSMYVTLQLTDADANNIKALTGFDNHSAIENSSDSDRLAADESWVLGGTAGTKLIKLYYAIPVRNESTHDVKNAYWLNDDGMIGSI